MVTLSRLDCKWPSRMQGQWFIQSRASGQQFSVGSRKSWFFGWAAAPTRIFCSRKVCGGLNVLRCFMRSSPPYAQPIEWIYFTNWSSGRRIIVNLSSCFECGPHERLYPELYSFFRASTCEAQTLLRYTTHKSKCIAWLAVKSWRSKQGGPWVLFNWPKPWGLYTVNFWGLVPQHLLRG